MSENTCNARIFNPTPYFLGANRIQGLEQPSDIIHHILHRDKSTGLSHLVFNNLKAKKRVDRTLIVDGSTLVIAVDGVTHPPPPQPPSANHGAPKSNNIASDPRAKAGTKASYGIYFGPSSLHNKSAFLPPSPSSQSPPQTKEAAILRGCYDALDYILTHLHSPTPTLKKLIIITTSPYLVKCLTSYVHVWETNGYRDSRGEFVENSGELASLAGMVLHYERVGVEVLFWLVGEGSGDMWEARRLAGVAVERVGVGEERKGEVEILDLNANLKGLKLGPECDMEALELELEKGFVNF
ncbi:hypothetical protein BKA65DRAFT_562713 [Rhexocercosporidium sp. MPI-PUGE-AT-0058]|nr:hypothetical protein BKA65DRAFT_562713 [Rhexocercosporidium sp. MPI-PUGE-AT-0058]